MGTSIGIVPQDVPVQKLTIAAVRKVTTRNKLGVRIH